MSGDDIEWLDEPAPPTPDESPAAPRRRRWLLAGVGALAVAAVLVTVFATGRDEKAPTPSPTIETYLAESSTPPVNGKTIEVPEPSTALLRAVNTEFPGAATTASYVSADDVVTGFDFGWRGLAIHVQILAAPPESPIDTRDENQLVVTGPRARIVVDSPGRALTGADYAAARRLVTDRRISR